MPHYFYEILDETGRRIDDDSDYPFVSYDEVKHNLRQHSAVEVMMPDRDTAWKTSDGRFFRVVEFYPER